MDKTVVVTVIRRIRDRRFHKFLTNRVKYHVHDENNAAKVGDLVEIIESRPMSKPPSALCNATSKVQVVSGSSNGTSTPSSENGTNEGFR